MLLRARAWLESLMPEWLTDLVALWIIVLSMAAFIAF